MRKIVALTLGITSLLFASLPLNQSPTINEVHAQNDDWTVACFDDSYDPFIYDSDECKNIRAINELEREKANCHQRRDEGAVWAVFLEDCITFTDFGGIAINYLLTFSSIIAGAMFVFASFKYLGSRGDPARLADARDMLLNTAIGMVLIATAYVTIQIMDAALTFGGDPINILPFFDIF